MGLISQPAVYQRFIAPTPTSPGSPNDLANLTLRFTPTTDYFDRFEPNDSLVQARKVTLPFNTIPVSQFTDIPDDHDVDFFRFEAKAGDVIVVQRSPGQLDTVLGLLPPTVGHAPGGRRRQRPRHAVENRVRDPG